MIEMILAATLFWQSPPRSDPNFNKVLYLYEQPECRNGRCQPPHIIGGWVIEEAVYKTYDGKEWGKAAEPPIPPPVKRTPVKPPIRRPNYGVDLDKKDPAYECTINGTGASCSDAYQKLSLSDDSGKPRLTLIDCDAEVPPDLKAACLVWRASRGHWSVEGFPDVAAVLTTAGGKLLYKGVADFAAIAKALDGPKQSPVLETDLPLGWIAGGLGVLILLWRRR